MNSSDMASRSLGMKSTLVMDQVAPGVPFWKCDEPTCKYPGLLVVMCPDNVGGRTHLG
jgi:hypothetical protein